MKTYSTPAILSVFIPGLGQLLKKQFRKATFLIVIFVAFVGVYDTGIYYDFPLLYTLGFALWVWNIYDAYNGQLDFFATKPLDTPGK